MFVANIIATDGGFSKLLTSMMNSDRVMVKHSKVTNKYNNVVLYS